MNEKTQLSERQITMRAIRALCLTAEAITKRLAGSIPLEALEHAATIAERCSDRAEHIAQYDIEELSEAARMGYVAQDMLWLLETLPSIADLLQDNRPARPADVLAIGTAAWAYTGKDTLPNGRHPGALLGQLTFTPKYHRQISEGENVGAWIVLGERPEGQLAMGTTHSPAKFSAGASLAMEAMAERTRIEQEGFVVV